jgi:hypothetical protein
MRKGEVRNVYTVLVGIPYIKKIGLVTELYGNKFRKAGRWKVCDDVDWLTDWDIEL